MCEVLKSWGTLYEGGQGVERVRASDHRMVIGGYVGSETRNFFYIWSLKIDKVTSMM